MVIARFLGNPGRGEVVHFHEPRFRRGEFAQKAVGTSDLEVRLDQAATAQFMPGSAAAITAEMVAACSNSVLARAKRWVDTFSQTEPHASLVEHFADGDIVGIEGEQVVRQLA